MTETKDTTEKTLRGGARKPLSLQRTVESGHVRQNFSHGRSKSVVVEKRRTRKLGGAEAEAAPVELQQPEPPVAKKKPAKPETTAPEKAAATPAGRTLSDEERDARARALAAARVRDDAERVAAESRPEPAPPPVPVSALEQKLERAPEMRSAPGRTEQAAPAQARTDSARAPAGGRPRTSYNPALQPREGGKPREIDMPASPRVKTEAEPPRRVGRPVA